MQERIRIGISTCLTGEPVRYDGQHKLDRFLMETLGRFVEYVPVCPEVECGLTVPREAMRLVGSPDAPHLMTQKTHIDHTDRMLTWAARRISELEKENLCGFIFKAKSPSSGMERVKIYNEKGIVAARGSGLFAREFMRHFPLLPVEDEGRLNDPDIRENFIERVFTLARYRGDIAGGRRPGALVGFHARCKYLIMAHSDGHLRRMGRLVAGLARTNTADTFSAYEALLLEALALHTTPRKHANVLMHMLGYFKDLIGPDEKQEMLELIDNYRAGLVPLVVPVTLVNHHVRRYNVAYLKDQYYLNPHPVELKLRNHA